MELPAFPRRWRGPAADSASRIPPLNFDGGKRARTHQFYEAVAFDEVFLVGCFKIFVHSVSGSELTTDLGRSVEHWRRLALLRSGEVEPYPRAKGPVLGKERVPWS